MVFSSFQCAKINEREEVMKKVIVLNASPRKNWNTAQLLKEAQRGAQAAGAETEYIDLYDLHEQTTNTIWKQ